MPRWAINNFNNNNNKLNFIKKLYHKHTSSVQTELGTKLR